MMGLFSRLWLVIHSFIYVLVTSSGVSGQSSECVALKPLFPVCSCNRKLVSTGVILGTSIDCSSRGLSLIPPSSSRQLSIYELKLNNNSILNLGNSILNNLKITRLDLSDNAIGSVNSHTFGYLGSVLKILLLSGNSSSQPPKHAFQYLTQLEDLTLQNYNVPFLEATSGYFLSFQKLRSLTLDNWKLVAVDPGTFQFTGSNMLQSLTFLNQVMQVLPIDELREIQLRGLKTLRVSHTNIYEITQDSFEMLRALTELDLSYNKIASLAPNCFNGANGSLVKLSLSNNNLTSTSLLPGLTYLTNLQHLDLSFNQITSVPDLSMIRTTKPLALYLNNNGITAVPENAFVGIADKLKTIDLSYNRILNFQANFGGFTLIESLFLSHQSINSPLVTPSSLGRAAGTLKQLSVGGNTLQPDLWSVVGKLYMLEVLNLTSAGLTSIPNFVLSNLTNLEKLDLSNNSLENITQETLDGPRNSLKFLSLTRNRISTLSSCMLYQYTSYPISMFLGENLLTCDCSVIWLWNGIRNGNITSIAGQEAMCSDNQLLANKAVDSFCTSPYTDPYCFDYYTPTTAPLLVTSSGVSGQSSECYALKPVFPVCSCSRKLDSAGVILGTSIDCSSRGSSTIPPSLRRQLSIYELKLNNNSILSLGGSILNNLKITRLDLSDNPIGSVDSHTFGYLGSVLKILLLSGNSSSQPPKHAFQYLTQLEDLTLQNYNVPFLEATSGYFLSFQKLRSLTLDNWKLVAVDPGAFQFTGSNMLQSLTFLNQVMQVLPIDELREIQLRGLKTLRISHTNIYEITQDSFEMLRALTELDLSYNKIASLAPNCFNGANGSLVKLSLSNNNLTSTSLLPGLTYLTNLQHLDLSFNQITSVPDLSMIRTTKPLALYLNNNGITAVPENAFVGIADKLKTIDLSYNRILNFQANFGGFTLIESLFLSHQSINSPLVTPSSLGRAAGTLKQLSVGGNTLQPDLWSVVGKLYMLEVLNLTSAGLTSIPNFTLSNLTNLEKLDLSNNSLENITQETLDGPRNSLKFLSLTRNRISTLSSCMLYQYTSYPISMFLGENLLTCDCSVIWLWNGIRNGNIMSIAGQEAMCSNNQLLANKAVDSFCTSPYTEPQCLEYNTTSSFM